MQMNVDQFGYFGDFGGRFVPEILLPALEELTDLYNNMLQDKAFKQEYNRLLKDFVGRPTPLYYAGNISEKWAGQNRIYLKREDLNHTGSHKINNAIGQALLAKKAGKTRLIAETGAGQHGVATATVAALFGLECHVYMGSVDIARQEPNVKRMKMLGAEVIPVESGSKTLKDAINEAIRDWVTNVRNTHYLIGSAVGPHPYPVLVKSFQSVIGNEAKEQIMMLEGRLPDEIIACVGGGSNAIGIFNAFVEDESVCLTGVEALGRGSERGMNAASINFGSKGVLHGAKTFVLQDENGQVIETHSISAGLDYPAVGPEHAYLHEIKRASYCAVTDEETLDAFSDLCRLEGIIPALESAHALAYAKKKARTCRNEVIIVNLSGRGDKDIDAICLTGNAGGAA